MKKVYLAGPIEIKDTWREETEKALKIRGLDPIDPIRNEKTQINSFGVPGPPPDLPGSLVVARDLSDLRETKYSGGFVLMNLNTSDEGRRPIGSLFELQWCYDNQVPCIVFMHEETTDPSIFCHSWVHNHATHIVSTLEEALKFVEQYLV